MKRSSKAHFVYMVECSDGTYYTGYSTDVMARVATHNVGRGARYTKLRLPVILVFMEERASLADALATERYIKGQTRSWKQQLIQ